MKGKLAAIEDGDMHPDDVAKIAKDLGVTHDEVISMNRRMAKGGDTSLNAPLREDGEGEWQDWLADDGPTQDVLVADKQEADIRHGLLSEALESLNDRERHILTQRRLVEEPQTLEDLSQEYGISRERVRQIEVRAFEKLQKEMVKLSSERRLIDA
jgi:RNA polymerase sigma-32 factor